MQRGIVAAVGPMTAGILAGCATPAVVEVKQSGDASLSCPQIKEQLELAEKFFNDAKKERGVTGTNVAAAVLILPGLLGTYVNTEEAMTAAKERQALLTKLAARRNCKLDDDLAAVEPVKPSPTVAKTPPTPAPARLSAVPPPTSMTNIEVQRKLLALGYQVGKPDGVMGQRTVDSIKKFQKENSLPLTGIADTETTIKLRQK